MQLALGTLFLEKKHTVLFINFFTEKMFVLCCIGRPGWLVVLCMRRPFFVFSLFHQQTLLDYPPSVAKHTHACALVVIA